jgi:hypothetical protein
MPVVTCPRCATLLRYPEGLIDPFIDCPKCNETFPRPAGSHDGAPLDSGRAGQAFAPHAPPVQEPAPEPAPAIEPAPAEPAPRDWPAPGPAPDPDPFEPEPWYYGAVRLFAFVLALIGVSLSLLGLVGSLMARESGVTAYGLLWWSFCLLASLAGPGVLLILVDIGLNVRRIGRR